MAERNDTSLVDIDEFFEFREDEAHLDHFITPNTFRESDSSDSAESSIFEKDQFDFLVNSPGPSTDPPTSGTGTTQIRNFILENTADMTPVPQTSKSELSTPQNTPNFKLVTDFNDTSSEDENYLVQAVHSQKKTYHVRKSVAHIEDTKTPTVPQENPHLNPKLTPEKPDNVDPVPPVPVKLFVNKLSLSKKKAAKKLCDVEQNAPNIPTVSTAKEKIPTKGKAREKKTSRFHKADDQEIENLQRNAKADKTNRQTAWGVKILKDWLESEELPQDFETLSACDFGELLKNFFASVRQVDGSKYSRSSLVCIRAALHRHLTGPPHNKKINLNSDGEFVGANSVLKGIIRDDKKKGEDTSIQHPPISNKDLALMYSSGTLSEENPRSLLFKTFFEVSLHYGRRGREGLKELKKTDIVFFFDDKNIEYCTLSFNPQEKNHQGLNPHQTEHSQRMFATGGDDCPLKSLKNFLDRLHPDCPAFFQRPRTKAYLKSKIWFYNSPLGVNAIGNLMSDISKEARLSRRCTNHSIRATCITQLKHRGVDPSDIISVTGHRNLQSLESYARTSDETRREMSHKLSVAIGKNIAPEEDPKKDGNNSKNEVESDVLTGQKQPTPNKRRRSNFIPLPSRSPTEKRAQTESPIQVVKPTPRKQIGTNPPEKEKSPKHSDNETSLGGATSSSSILNQKTVRKLEFDEIRIPSKQKPAPEEYENNLPKNPGQTIIIQQGNVVHIHYH